jgi:hypothetical protein
VEWTLRTISLTQAEDISEHYIIGESGSLSEMRYLFTRLDDIQVVLYNGDWDGVVPFGDTLKNLEKLNMIHINSQ